MAWKFEVYEDAGDKFRWRLIASNDTVVRTARAVGSAGLPEAGSVRLNATDMLGTPARTATDIDREVRDAQLGKPV
jgi:hypothetical protein